MHSRFFKLRGPEPPHWFEDASDGCSVPSWPLRILLQSAMFVDSCHIHDYRYYLFAMAYPDSIAREHARAMADFEFKLNIKASIKNGFVRWFYGLAYFQGVRFGGKHTIRTLDEVVAHKPEDAWRSVVDQCKELYPDYDHSRVSYIVQKWKDS